MRVWERGSVESGNESLGMRVWEQGSVGSGNESLCMRLKWSGYESLGTRLHGVWKWESGYESLGTRLRGVWEWESGYEAQVVCTVCHLIWEIKHCPFILTTNLLSPYTENSQVLLGLPVQVSQNIHTTHTQCHWHTVQSMYHASGSTRMSLSNLTISHHPGGWEMVRFDRLYRHAHVCKIHVSKSTSVLQA